MFVVLVGFGLLDWVSPWRTQEENEFVFCKLSTRYLIESNTRTVPDVDQTTSLTVRSTIIVSFTAVAPWRKHRRTVIYHQVPVLGVHFLAVRTVGVYAGTWPVLLCDSCTLYTTSNMFGHTRNRTQLQKNY